MKNKDWGRGRGGGLNREGGVINFPPLKRGVLIREGGAYLRGGLHRGFTVCAVKPSYDYCSLQLCQTAANLSDGQIGRQKQDKRGT